MDNRLIENISAYDKGLKLIQELKPVTYHKKGSRKKEVGLISQDVQPLEPLTVEQNSTGVLVIQYEKLLCLLVNAVQELSAEVEVLKQSQVKKKGK